MMIIIRGEITLGRLWGRERHRRSSGPWRWAAAGKGFSKGETERGEPGRRSRRMGRRGCWPHRRGAGGLRERGARPSTPGRRGPRRATAGSRNPEARARGARGCRFGRGWGTPPRMFGCGSGRWRGGARKDRQTGRGVVRPLCRRPSRIDFRGCEDISTGGRG